MVVGYCELTIRSNNTKQIRPLRAAKEEKLQQCELMKMKKSCLYVVESYKIIFNDVL